MDIVLISIIGIIVTIIGIIVGLIPIIQKLFNFIKKKFSYKIDNTFQDIEIDLKKKSQFLKLCKENFPEEKIESFSMLILSSAILLERDRLSGSWGRTIHKHIKLTQYFKDFSSKSIDKYVIPGSLTHTFHALNGLIPYYCMMGKVFDPLIAKKILNYLTTWRLSVGTFPTPVTNFDGSIGTPGHYNGIDQEIYRKQTPQLVRHTACAILTINRLLILRDNIKKILRPDNNAILFWEQIIGTLNAYNLKALKILSGYYNIQEIIGVNDAWGKVQYTPSYIALAIEEGINRYHTDLDRNVIKNLKKFRSILIDWVFDHGLKEGENFFFQNTNKKAYYFYTMIVLNNYLNIKTFIADPRASIFCNKMITALAEIVIINKGLPHGHTLDAKTIKSNFNDIGVTSQYLLILSKYQNAFDVKKSHKESFHIAVNFIIENIFDIKNAHFNTKTQGWSAVLQLLNICDEFFIPHLKDILNNKKLLKQKQLVDILGPVSKRDFKGYTNTDIKKRFIMYLMKDPVLKVKIDIDSNINELQSAMESHFNRRSFMAFLENFEIPFVKNSLEEMIGDTLTLFLFKEKNKTAI